MDLQRFAVTRNGTVNLTVPQWTVSGQLCDSTTGAVLHDFTGANVESFPQLLGKLTAAQQDEFVVMVVLWLLDKRFGVT